MTSLYLRKKGYLLLLCLFSALASAAYLAPPPRVSLVPKTPFPEDQTSQNIDPMLPLHGDYDATHAPAREFTVRGSTDLSALQFDFAGFRKKYGLHMYGVICFFISIKTGLYGFAQLFLPDSNCREAQELRKSGQKYAAQVFWCVVNSIIVVLSWALLALSGPQAITTLQKIWADTMGNTRGTPKKDLTLGAQAALPALSDMFGFDVRHIGFWNDTTVAASPPGSKRDTGDGWQQHEGGEVVTRPVFGGQLKDGRDVHFSFLNSENKKRDEDDDYGSISVRFKENDRALLDKLREGAGLDVKVKPLMEPAEEYKLDEEEIRKVLAEQLGCIMSQYTFGGYSPGSTPTPSTCACSTTASRRTGSLPISRRTGLGRKRSVLDDMGGYRPYIDEDRQCRPRDEL
ncbi:hypothetical protein B0H66DRAFT_605520 [Apodospora peruviana]|uniref:Uncharacterized protein n=1 Tax=Apodospora peruviana TaxID=516989 RepID=A0AAE0HX65_9PEZI|nr:hypothetical protein B0H66DRAFT_605520 [Apodospora peruviana]